ncbi:MAG: L,D-transpeptidase [Acidobacteria bacterium]|nr:L,D-transpeptidase [Acidobacteriota bacterium]
MKSRPHLANYLTLQNAHGHSTIVIRINPRRQPRGVRAGDGSAVISLLDGAGNLIASFRGSAPRFNGRAIGVRGPARNVTNGDTPFGVYRYTFIGGGSPNSRLGTGYGTGKIYVDDRRMYGEMIGPPRRALIRLHGGGSGLRNPYALNQALLATLGCVRMRNGDVNALIRFIKQLPPDRSLRFIFMGSDRYLHGLARDVRLRRQPWWLILRTSLGISERRTRRLLERLGSLPDGDERMEPDDNDRAAPVADSELSDLVKQFSEDEGALGQDALNRLRPRVDALLRLQRDLPSDDPLQPRISFALCYLGRDCEDNMRVIESAVGGDSPYRGFPADLAAQMLSRLIDRKAAEGREQEATTLMGKLFEAAPAADGALSEGLGVAFTDKLRRRTDIFFTAFKPFFAGQSPESRADRPPSTVRSRVYNLIGSVGRVTAKDLATIRRRSESRLDSSEDLEETIDAFTREYLEQRGGRNPRRRVR